MRDYLICFIIVERVIGSKINTPSVSIIIMHHHAVLAPAISLLDYLIIRLALKPTMRAIIEPKPPSQNNEKANPYPSILLTLTYSSKLPFMLRN